MPRLYSINLGGGGTSTVDGRANEEILLTGLSVYTVTFSSALPSNLYALNVSIQNDLDAEPIYMTAVIKNKTAAGFDVELSAPPDSANYILNYTAIMIV